MLEMGRMGLDWSFLGSRIWNGAKIDIYKYNINLVGKSPSTSFYYPMECWLIWT